MTDAPPAPDRRADDVRAAARLSVAPMMDWTDRHCRFFHRQMTGRALVYTEMVTDAAVIHGPRDRLLASHPAEHPVALQLGGSEPAQLAQAVRLAAPYGYDEINLNCGCPSDRVQSGCFGAVLMETPAKVADCVAAMIAESPVEVTVKCRIGVDDQDPRQSLPAFLEAVRGAGVRRVIVHARKAWLQGLSPKQNREVPPLDYALVLEIKRAFPDLHLSLNGGITSLDQAKDLLAQGFDGVMLGRAAYHDPSVLLAADRRIFGVTAPDLTPEEVVARMLPYIEAHLASGGRLHQVTRHMLGLFNGRPGARAWRRLLSEGASRPGAGPDLLQAAAAGIAEAA
jgi:tRNA-dihydrouridine synthase A